MMVIDNKYNIGDIVYLRTDIDQLQRIIYRIMVYKGEVLYGLAMGTQTSDHYEFELSLEKDITVKAQ